MLTFIKSLRFLAQLAALLICLGAGYLCLVLLYVALT